MNMFWFKNPENYYLAGTFMTQNHGAKEYSRDLYLIFKLNRFNFETGLTILQGGQIHTFFI